MAQRYKDPRMQRLYETMLSLAADPKSELYVQQDGPQKGAKRRGAGHRAAFWDGYATDPKRSDGQPWKFDYTGPKRSAHVIPGTMSAACFMAGREWAKREMAAYYSARRLEDKATKRSARPVRKAPKDARADAMADALRRIRNARDYCAEHGRYPAGTVGADQAFDDWAADLADSALSGKDTATPPPRVLLYLEGGTIQSVRADAPVDVITIDGDTDGGVTIDAGIDGAEDAGTFTDADGETFEAVAGRHLVEIEPQEVARAMAEIEAHWATLPGASE